MSEDRLKGALFSFIIKLIVKETLHSRIHCTQRELLIEAFLCNFKSSDGYWLSSLIFGEKTSYFGNTKRIFVSHEIVQQFKSQSANYQHEEKWTKQLRCD